MNLSGNPLDYLIAFFAGLGISFTPCVYPLIPITAAYIGVESSVTKLKGLALSLIYVTGIAVTYSILGLIASLTGTFFGKISSHPLTNILLGGFIIFSGLSFWGFFSISLPRIIKPAGFKKNNYFSIFILGLISGLAVSPCLTPVLGTILVYLVTKKDMLYGITLLFSFAFGMGFMLILIGTFSAALVTLPKSGKWQMYIKHLGAIILIIMGGYFILKGIAGL